jgi:hypothetical protein
MDSTRTARYDAYKAVCGLVEELRKVKLFDVEADSILWAARRPVFARRKQAHGHRASTRPMAWAEGEAVDRPLRLPNAKRVRGEKRPAGCSDFE